MEQENGGHKSLDQKYQKLFNEYSKLKTQMVALKKSVTDGEAANRGLKDRLKESEKLTKKLEQEVENLEFRNQQLTKRVSVLQEDLNHESQLPKTRGNHGSSFTSHVNSDEWLVMGAELESKIEEIKELHLKLSSIESQNIEDQEDLRSQLTQLRLDSDERVNHLQEVIKHQKQEMFDLNQENKRLEMRLKEMERDVIHKIPKGSLEDKPGSEKTPEDMLDVSNGPEEDMMIHDHLNQRISELMDSLQAADSKSLVYYSECNRLKQRLAIVSQEKKASLEALQELQVSYQQLKDELNTSVRNYETQLSTMSEHLACVTENWSKQQIEMDSLKETINSRKSGMSKK